MFFQRVVIVDDLTLKPAESVALVEVIFNDCKDKRVRNACAKWLTGTSRFDKLLGIVPPPQSPHPAVAVWRDKRDVSIQNAGMICIKPSMNRTLTDLISEIKLFYKVWGKYNNQFPNPLWTDLQVNLFWAFYYHEKYGPGLFPQGKTVLRNILNRHDFFSGG